MSWEHFEIRDQGICTVLVTDTNERTQCHYELGIITTGKSRMFWGYQIIINYKDVTIAGRSKGYSETYSQALKDCNTQMAEQGLTLLVAGNLPTYSESAMSGPAGHGYIKGYQTGVRIMSPDDVFITT
ncbi:MAG: hypothetical protein D0531_12165 [Methylococcales bacterium]|nr:MAG: hypothetical protein D0531_12165 [Methylococcales bacterium]